MCVAVVLPTYNEAENLERLIREIEGLNLELTIAVIDDSSPDETANIARKLKGEYSNIHLISRPQKLGLGTAITDGFRYLLGSKEGVVPDYIITMDADYSHNPKDIPRLLNTAREGCDLVLGSRYVDEGRVIGSSITRRVISRIANIIAGMAIHTRVHDCTSGFRCYSNRYVKHVLPRLHSQTYEIQIETIQQASLHSFSVKEVPITFVNRKRGKPKLSAAEFRAFLTYSLRAATESFPLKRRFPLVKE